MICLFTYGTLMHAEIWKAIIQRECSSSRILLQHYTCRQLKDRHYPGMIPQIDSKVQGILYHDLTMEEIRQLDVFEGYEYTRIRLTALENEVCSTVFTYLYTADRSNIKSEEWDYVYFVKNDLEDFRDRFTGWNR